MKRVVVPWALTLTTVCVLVSGCGLMGTKPAAARLPSGPALASTGGYPSPFRLDVVDELNDGERLHLLTTVRSLAAWNPSSVVVRLTGYKNGEATATSDYPLRQLAGTPKILENQPLTVSLSIPAAGITDYEVQLLWGEDGNAIVGTHDSLVAIRKQSIEQESLPCATKPCPIQFAVAAELHNTGAQAVESVRLGVGFLMSGRVDSGEKFGGIPPSEEFVDLSNLHLAPGESRAVRIVIDQPVPALQAGEVTPSVRVVG